MRITDLWQRAESWLYRQRWYVQNPLSWLGHSLAVGVAALIGRDLGLAMLGFYGFREVESALRRKQPYTVLWAVDSVLDVALPAVTWWLFK